MKKYLWLSFTAATLASCTTIPSTPPFEPTTTFNASDVAWSRGVGPNTVDGNALLRTRGGDVRTCAGEEVFLIADSAYARERITYLYAGALDRGFNYSRPIADGPLAYKESHRRTTCDAQGDFSFRDIPDGTYYVTTRVVWEAPGQYALSSQGGALMHRVELTGGETANIVLTAN